jgi:hypothetical protein
MTNLMWPEMFADRAIHGWPSGGMYCWGTPWPTNTDFGIPALIDKFINPRRNHFWATHSITNTAFPVALANTGNAGIPISQPSSGALLNVVALEFNPSSGNQAEEYICLTNSSSFALDISGWKLDGGINFTFRPGTVVPSNGLVYVSPNVTAFRARGTGPRGGQGLFVTGPYKGQLSARGETILVSDERGRLVSTNLYVGNPSLAQQYLRVTELMYNPAPLAGNTNDAQEFEFIEFKNISTNLTLDLTGVHFTNGLEFSFTGAALTNLAPQQTVILAKNPAVFAARYGALPNVVGPYLGYLNNGGERLQVVDASNEEVLDFSFNDTWYPLTDGLGFSLVIVNELAAPDDWSLKSNWRASGTVGGTPGAPDPGAPAIAPVVVNELLTAPDTAQFQTEFVELFNGTAGEVDVSGWFLTDDFFAPQKFRLPAGTVMPAGTYLFIPELAFHPPGGGFAFSNSGGAVFLFSGDAATNLTGYFHGGNFGAAATGVTFGRVVNSQTNEDFVAQLAPTPGTNNLGPRVGPVVVSEIMYFPASFTTNDPPASYVELLNITATNVPLYHLAQPTNTWRLRHAVDFDFPPDVSLAPGATLLVVGFDPADTATLAAFQARYGIATNVPIYGPWQGGLNNTDDVLELKQPELAAGPNPALYVLVEKIHYQASAPWPTNAAGRGAALNRRGAGDYANEPTNWVAAAPSPGTRPPGGQAPAITLQPQSQVLPGGTNTTFTVGASGDAPLSYQWSLNGLPLWGATNASLVLPDVQRGQAGVYQALALNAAGSALSAPATLTVPVSLLTQPQDLALFPNRTAVFAVGVAGDEPLTYQWRFNGTNLAGATNSVLIKNNVQPADAGAYTVLVSNRVSVLSAPATLTVWSHPLILTQPQSQLAVTNTGVTFSVIATSSTTLRYQWRINTTNLANATNASYAVASVTTNEVGFYDVRVSDSYGSLLSDPASLGIKSKPVYYQQPTPSNTVAYIGAPFTMNAIFDGTLPINYRWLTNNQSALWVSTSTTNITYTIPSVTIAHAGGYRIFATNIASSSGQQSIIAYLAVIEPLTNQTVAPGSNVTFRFLASTYYPTNATVAQTNFMLRYQWFFNETNLLASVTNASTVTNVFLTLTNVQMAQAGTYTVVATNNNKTTFTQSATLTVAQPVPRLDGVLLPSGGNGPVTIGFLGLAGQSYAVLYKDRLEAGAWQVLTNIPVLSADQAIQAVDAAAAAQPQRFYRLATPSLP